MPLTHLEDPAEVDLTWHVEAPRARVWQCLTEADLLRQWLGELVTGRVGPGSTFEVDHGEGYRCRSTVVGHVEHARLELTWEFPDEPPSAVAVVLDDTERGTRLRLTHHGLGDLAASYRDGWCVHLCYLEAAALGTPLPTSMFWRLHATMARLARR